MGAKKKTGQFQVDDTHWEKRFGGRTEVYLSSHQQGRVAVARLTHNIVREEAQLIANVAIRVVGPVDGAIASQVGLEILVPTSGSITKEKAAQLARLMVIACNEEAAERSRGTRSTERHNGTQPAGMVRSHLTRDGRQPDPVGRFRRG